MAYALVGSVGAISTGASGASVTPAWGAGESRTAGNLLICWIAADGGGVVAAGGTGSPGAGWTLAWADVGANSAAVAVYFRIATGADAAPTVSGVGAAVTLARLAEFSGNKNPMAGADNVSGANGAGSPVDAINGAADVTAGELVVICYAFSYTTAATKTFTPTLNNGMTALGVGSTAATSTINHAYFAYGIPTGNGAADTCSMAFTTTKVVDASGVIASFEIGAAAATARAKQKMVGQAVMGAATRCWARRRSGIVVPRLWVPEGAVI